MLVQQVMVDHLLLQSLQRLLHLEIKQVVMVQTALAVFFVQVAEVVLVELETQVLIFQLIQLVDQELQVTLAVQLYSTVVVEAVVFFVV